MDAFVRERVREQLERLEVPFDHAGVDPYGVSKKHLEVFFTALGWLYHRYFRAQVVGLEHIPARGRAMIVGNHSGGIAIDGAMIIASLFFDMDPPRLGQSMVDKFLNRLPFASQWTSKTGQVVGLPRNATQLLEDDRMLLVFPEGSRGTAKLFHERYTLKAFGTGFLRLALETKTPIIPVGFLGGGEAFPTVLNLYRLGKLVGAPYVPITPYLLPVPLPVQVEIRYGEPILFEGTGVEEDSVILAQVSQVKDRIEKLIEEGRR